MFGNQAFRLTRTFLQLICLRVENVDVSVQLGGSVIFLHPTADQHFVLTYGAHDGKFVHKKLHIGLHLGPATHTDIK